MHHPMELNNLAGERALQKTQADLKGELAAWTQAQGDDLQPHQRPYLTSEPLPDFIGTAPHPQEQRPGEFGLQPLY